MRQPITGIAIFMVVVATVHAVPVFIGTSGGRMSSAKGIYRADFNPETGALTPPILAAEYGAPGFLAQHPSKPVLLAIGAPKTPFADDNSSLAAFAIGKDEGLVLLGEASTGGKGACHLAIDATGNTVAVANYGDGTITTVRLDGNGVPMETVSVITNKGSGPNKSRQDGPHAHGVYFNKANTRLYVPDLGLDRIHIFPFDAVKSKLGDPLPPLYTATGAGPRHMAFSPDETHAYVVNELDLSILAATHETGTLKTHSVTPMHLNPNESSTAAEIEVSDDGNFVYASIRTRSELNPQTIKDAEDREVRSGIDAEDKGNTIDIFKRDSATGSLSFVDSAYCGGKIPRHFKIAPGGKWLLCGHQDSHTISVLPRDPESGRLGAPACTVSVPSPICILFAR